MDANTITAYANLNPNVKTIVTLTDDTTLTGTVAKVDEKKGLTFKTEDGKTVTRALSKIKAVKRADLPEEPMTTADVAELFEISAKDLRVYLRRFGMGVGQGRRYSFAAGDIDTLRTKLKEEREREAAEAAAALAAAKDDAPAEVTPAEA